MRRLLRKLGNGHAAALILLLGLLSMVAMFGLLAELIHEILFDQTFGTFDLQVFRWLQNLGTPALDRVFLASTRLGNPPALLAVVAACGAMLLLTRRVVEAIAFAGCFAGTAVTMMALKWLLLRNRPAPAIPLLSESSSAFPSAHASLSLVAYVFAAYIVAQQAKTASYRVLFLGTGLGFAFLIGLSRVFLGVHWLSDVLGGYALGGIWLALLLTVIELRRLRTPAPRAEHLQSPAVRRALILLVAGLALFLVVYVIFGCTSGVGADCHEWPLL